MYVHKKDFDEVFELTKLIDNKLLTIEVEYDDDDFYHIYYNEKIYQRFIKTLKLSPNEKIKK